MEPINVVLVHGAWADGSSWSKVIPLLQDKGFNVTAAQIPLTSIEDDVAITKRLLAAQNGPTVLVGHSYGGIVASGAGNGSPNVKALVYVAAFGLDEGESIEALGKSGSAPAGAAQIRPDGSGFLWINRAGFCFRRRPDSSARHGRGAKAAQRCFLYRQSGRARLEEYSVLVHGCDERPDDPAAGRGIYGEKDGCDYAHRAFESRGDGFTPERNHRSHRLGRRVNRKTS